MTAFAQRLHGLYLWLLFVLIAPPAWVLTALAPRPAFAWSVNRLAARTLLRLAGMPLTVRGLEHLPGSTCVLVANHASYLDGLALFAALPVPFAFVAKRAFLGHPFVRIFLRGLGTQFVEGFGARQSVEDASRMAGVAIAGTSMAVFPEGTFRRMTGLGSFRLGAFAAAAAAKVAVLPVAIRGTREALRDGQWLVKRGPITVTIGIPVLPPAHSPHAFAAAVALRDAARAHILAHCGEPDTEPG